MKEYRLRGGAVMTDADFERLSAEAEAGNYPGTPGAWIVRPQGRPRLDGASDPVPVTFKTSHEQRDAIDAKAHEQGQTRSEWLRRVVDMALAS